MRVAVVAEYYPRRRDPVLGVWAHRQALAARDAGANVTVLALERPLPPASALRSPGRLGRALAGAAVQPRHDELDGLDVEYVRFLSPPRERSYATWDSWARGPLGKALARLHEQRPLDLVHAHYALPAGAAALEFTEREKLPLAISVHGGDVLGPLVSTPAARARVGEVLGRAQRGAVQQSPDARALRRADGHAGADDRGPPGRRGARERRRQASRAHHRHARARDPPQAPRGRDARPGGARGPAARAALAGDRRRPRAPGAGAAGRAARRGGAGGLGGTAPPRGRAARNWPAAI